MELLQHGKCHNSTGLSTISAIPLWSLEEIDGAERIAVTSSTGSNQYSSPEIVKGPWLDPWFFFFEGCFWQLVPIFLCRRLNLGNCERLLLLTVSNFAGRLENTLISLTVWRTSRSADHALRDIKYFSHQMPRSSMNSFCPY